MKLITVATHSERYFPVLKESARKNGFELVVLGWGEKWKGFNWRIEKIIQYLNTLDRKEIVAVVDAYDVVILRSADVLKQRFEKNEGKEDMIVGWERANSKIIEALSTLIFQKCNSKRMNAGTYVGRSAKIYAALSAACKTFDCKDEKDTNDQVLLSKYCKLRKHSIRVDDRFDFFLVINSALKHFDLKTNKIEIVKGKLVYDGKLSPCMIHGIGATNMNELIEKLGYDNPNPIGAIEVLDYDIKYMAHYAYYLRYYLAAFFSVYFIVLLLIVLKYK